MVAYFSRGQDKFSRRLKRHMSSSTCTPGRLDSGSGMGAVGSTARTSAPGRTSFVLARGGTSLRWAGRQDPLLALLAGAALVSHVSGMYHNRHDPVELALGLCSMLITLAAVFTVEQMKNSSPDIVQRWWLVKQFSIVFGKRGRPNCHQHSSGCTMVVCSHRLANGIQLHSSGRCYNTMDWWTLWHAVPRKEASEPVVVTLLGRKI